MASYVSAKLLESQIDVLITAIDLFDIINNALAFSG